MLQRSRVLLPQRFAPVGNNRFLKSPRLFGGFFFAWSRTLLLSGVHLTHAESNATLSIDLENLHANHIPFGEFVADLLHSLF